MRATSELGTTAAPRLSDAVGDAAGQRSVTRPSGAAWAWVRLAGLLLVAAAAQLVYVAFWPLSYYLTQAPDFTYEFLVQYPAVWERLLPLLAHLEAWLPGSARSLDLLVNMLMGAFVAAFVLYLLAFFLVRAGLPRGWGVAAVLAPALAFQATLFAMPGLFTTDLFSYVMYGQIAGVLAVNPYTSQPSWFPDVRILQWIHPLWHNAPSIYGPAWTDLAVPLARRVAAATDVDKVLAYKALVNVGHLAGVAALAYVVHRLRPGAVLESALLYTWNPLILFEFGGNGHNDAVMIAVMLLGLALYVSASAWLGIVALTVSFLVKMTSVLLVPFYAMAWARAQSTWPRFFGVGTLAVLTVAVVVVAFYWPWWDGIGTIGPILLWSQGPMFNNYVPDILAVGLAGRRVAESGGLVDPALALEEIRASIKLVARVVFVGICLWELWRVRGGLGVAGAGARVMLAFLLVVNTWVLPWYFTWPLALGVVLGWRSITLKVLLGFSLSAPAVMYYHHFWHPYMSDAVYLLYLAPLLIAPVAWLSSFAASRWRTHRRRAGMAVAARRDALFVADARRS